MYYRCFALSRYADWEAAEAAARLWLRGVHALLSALPAAEPRLSPRNRSGVAGVFLHTSLHRLKSGRVAAYPAYVARWPKSPIGLKWMFATSGGEEGAFLRACITRELRTADRCRVEWVARTLTPEKRAALLGLRRPAPVAVNADSSGAAA